jgi:hypothetical protein
MPAASLPDRPVGKAIFSFIYKDLQEAQKNGETASFSWLLY